MPCLSLSYAPEQKAKTSLRPSRQAIKRAALALAAALGVVAGADFGHYYLTTGRYLETTDDAYVKADSTIIAPKVSGYIAQVLVGDNQTVRPASCWRRSTIAISAPRSTRPAPTSPRPKPRSAISMHRLPCSSRSSSRGTADVAAAEANLKFAQEEQARYDGLMKTGSGTVQRAQQTDAALRASNAQLQHAKSGLLAAERKVDVLSTERAKASRAARPRPRGRAAGGVEPLLHRASPRRSTARSARARSGSGSSCRPARS